MLRGNRSHQSDALGLVVGLQVINYLPLLRHVGRARVEILVENSVSGDRVN